MKLIISVCDFVYENNLEPSRYQSVNLDTVLQHTQTQVLLSMLCC